MKTSRIFSTACVLVALALASLAAAGCSSPNDMNSGGASGTNTTGGGNGGY